MGPRITAKSSPLNRGWMLLPIVSPKEAERKPLRTTMGRSTPQRGLTSRPLKRCMRTIMAGKANNPPTPAWVGHEVQAREDVPEDEHHENGLGERGHEQGQGITRRDQQVAPEQGQEGGHS